MEKIRSIQLEKINKMLMEMASGNFFYRLKRSGDQNKIEAMTMVLNMLAEEIQESIKHQGYVNSHGVVKHFVQINFLLNGKGLVEMVNRNTCQILSLSHTEFLGRSFEEFLDAPSKKRWAKLWGNSQFKDFHDTSLELTLVTSEGLLVPNTCHITMLGGPSSARKTLVNTILYTKDRAEREQRQWQGVVDFKNKERAIPKSSMDGPKHRPRLSFDDIRKIRKGRDMILNNLEKDLPSLKEFAHLLGTNEFKLKYGFKDLYGTSVYRFLLQERLRKAKMLIQYTDFNIKTIAYKTGFKSIPHFSRVFKKTYGYAPSEFRKSLQDKPTK